MRWLALLSLGALMCVCAQLRPVRSHVPARPGERCLTQSQIDAAAARVQNKIEKRRHSAESPFSDAADALEFFMSQRLGGAAEDDPTLSRYPIEHLQRITREIEAKLARRGHRGGEAPVAGVLGWSPIGPHDAGGRTRALVIDPTDPDVMYAAGVTGGVFKSTDAGATWTPTDDTLQTLAISALALDPTEPDVLYAGTGEGFSGGPGFRGVGIFKSTDAGESWALLESTLDATPDDAFAYVNDLVISPAEAATIYAATRTGVWRSDNAGATWSIVLANPFYTSGAIQSGGSIVGCTDLAVRPGKTGDVLYAAMGSFIADGLFRSTNSGNTWQKLGTPADVARSNQGRMSIDIAPSDPDVIYVLMADNGGGGQIGQLVDLYRSLDAGDTWQARLDHSGEIEPWLLSNLILATGCAGDGVPYSQGWHDIIVRVDPVDPDVVWAGGIDLFRSDDAGRTFGIASYWFLDRDSPNYAHADQHAIVFHPAYDGANNRTLYVANDGGVFRTADARAGLSREDCPLDTGHDPLPALVWDEINTGYAVSQFHHGDAHPSEPVFAGGTQDNGTWSTDQSASPDWSRVLGGDGGYVAIDPRDPDVIYAETQGFPTIRKSTDGGQSWSLATTGIDESSGLFIAPLAMDPSNPDTLWTGGAHPWRTIDGAAGWQRASAPGRFAEHGLISAIAIDPSNTNAVMLGFHRGAIARTGSAMDPSPVWTVADGASGLPDAWVSSIAIDPTDPGTAYATYSTFGVPHAWRTTDAGATWHPIDGAPPDAIPDVPAHWIAPRPGAPGHLFVGTETGVFATTNAGASWQPVGSGIPNTIVETLKFRDADTLAAFTHGRGAFQTRLIPVDACEGDTNTNGVVDIDDVLLVIFRLGAEGEPGTVEADANHDGIVDSNDIIYVAFRLGSNCFE